VLAEDVEVIRRASGSLVVQESHGRFAAVDPEITPDLRREGISREIVSRVQRLRKESGLEVSDRIRLWVAGDEPIPDVVAEYGGRIAEETLARELHVGEAPDGDHYARAGLELEGIRGRLAITRDS